MTAVVQGVREGLADLLEMDHADTCGSVLSPGIDYPCSCWKSDAEQLLSGGTDTPKADQ